MPDSDAPETPPQPQAPATTSAGSRSSAPPAAATSSAPAPTAPAAKPPATPAPATAPTATAPTATAPTATAPTATAPTATAPTATAPTAAAPAATAVATEPEAPVAPKIKPKKATQRACDEKDAKGKLCCGHLKRWYDYPKEIEALAGKQAEIYRCEFCQTIYKPDRSKTPHSYTLRY